MKGDDKVLQSAKRRGFLKLAGLGTVAGAAAAGAGAAKAAIEAAPAKKAAGYRETEHVKTVYRLARF